MTRREIAQLACKILALFVLCQALGYLYQTVAFLVFEISSMIRGGLSTSSFGPNMAFASIGVGMLLLSYILWWQSSRIGSRMVAADPTPVTASSLDQASVFSIAMSVVGAFIAIKTLPELVGTLVFLRGVRSSQYLPDAHMQVRLWTGVAKLMLAIWLLFGSRGIVNVIRRVRSWPASDSPGAQE